MATLKELWRNLTKEERLEAAVFSLKRETVAENLKQQIYDIRQDFELMARTLGFRLKSFQGITPAEFMNKLELFINTADEEISKEVIGGLLFNFILSKYDNILIDFLDNAGVAHQNGLFAGDGVIIEKRFATKAILAIKDKYPDRDLGIYFSYLLTISNGRDTWMHIGEALLDAGFNPFAAVKNQEKSDETDQKISTSGLLDTPEFTTFDGIIIKEIIASAIGQEGALSRLQIEDLVDEASELNAARQKTFFHKGFMHAVFEMPYTFHFPGENESRRVWYLAGVIHGLYRQNKKEEILRVMADNDDIMDQMKNLTDTGCIIKVTDLTFDIYVEAGKVVALLPLVESVLRNKYCTERDFAAIVFKIMESGSNIIRQGKPVEAIEMLGILESRQALLHETVVNKLKRKKAQAYQMKGDLRHADKIFTELLETDIEFEDRANTLADYALVKAGYKSIYNIIKLETPGQAKSLKDTLSVVTKILSEASVKYGETAVNSNFCLGLYRFLEGGKVQETIELLEKSLFGMEKKEKAYRYGGLIDWNRFLLGIARLESVQTENYAKAADCIQKSIESGVEFSPWLGLRALKAAAVYDDLSIAEKISGMIKNSKKISPREVFDAIGFDNVLKMQSLLDRFFEVRESGKIDSGYVFQGSKKMLELSLKDGCDHSCGTAVEILDGLEKLSEEDSETRKNFIELLKQKKYFQPAWDAHDAGNCLIRLNEKDGNNKEAAVILKMRFFERLNSPDEVKRLDSVNILERIRELNTESQEEFQKLSSLLSAKNLTEDKITQMDSPAEVNMSLLLIGGDETQASYQADILSHFAKKMPRLKVDFVFSGWSSNWIYDYENINKRLDKYGAVILSPYVRTTLGQRVRKLCNERKKHRYNCTGKGKTFIIRSIESAVKMERSFI